MPFLMFCDGGQTSLSLSFLSSVSELPVEMLQGILCGAGDLHFVPVLQSLVDTVLRVRIYSWGWLSWERFIHRRSGRRLERKRVTISFEQALGTGTLTTALKRGRRELDAISAALDGMAMSNGLVASLAQKHVIHAATDITGLVLLTLGGNGSPFGCKD